MGHTIVDPIAHFTLQSTLLTTLFRFKEKNENSRTQKATEEFPVPETEMGSEAAQANSLFDKMKA